MIHRQLSSEITRLSKHFKVTAVLGPRQSGKTTLCRYLFPDYHFFSLEDAVVVQEIAKSPKRFLEEFAGKGIIFDEAQKYPELFPVIKVVADENPHFRFILTGSSNFLSMEKITESLAGRMALTTLLPLSLSELKDFDRSNTNKLLFTGGYPAIWGEGMLPRDVVSNYYNTYIQRDVRQISNLTNLSAFQIFIQLCAGRIGSEFNANSLSAEVGVTVKTIQEWLVY